VTTIASTPELKLRQYVLCGDLQILEYHLVDSHKLSPQIVEVMEFQR
jgi:hypothetical protein